MGFYTEHMADLKAIKAYEARQTIDSGAHSSLMQAAPINPYWQAAQQRHLRVQALELQLTVTALAILLIMAFIAAVLAHRHRHHLLGLADATAVTALATGLREAKRARTHWQAFWARVKAKAEVRGQ